MSTPIANPSRSRRRKLKWALAAFLGFPTILLGVRIFNVWGRYDRQIKVAAIVERIGGSVGYEYDPPLWIEVLMPDDPRRQRLGKKTIGPNWLRARLPMERIAECFLVIDAINIDSGQGLKHWSNLSGELIERDRPAVTKEAFRRWVRVRCRSSKH